MNEFIDDPYILAFYDTVRGYDGENAVKSAIELAYGDVKRTLRGFADCERRDALKAAASIELNYGYEKLLGSEPSRKNFDAIHGVMCEKIVDIFKWSFPIHYGQAQKWVNLFFKYMYVFDGRTEPYAAHFHIPVDGDILSAMRSENWYALYPAIDRLEPLGKMTAKDYAAFIAELRRYFRRPLACDFHLRNKYENDKNAAADYAPLTKHIDYFSNLKNTFAVAEHGRGAVEYTPECREFIRSAGLYAVADFAQIAEGIYKRRASASELTATEALAELTSVMHGMRRGNRMLLDEYARSGRIFCLLSRLEAIAESGTKDSARRKKPPKEKPRTKQKHK